MQNNQNNIYVPTLGMDRDTHPVRLKDGTYTFAKNISVEDSSGNGLPMVQNEPSTIFCKEFKSGKNIIGFKYEPSLRKTFLFIVDTITGFSEIGYISHDAYFYGESGEVEFCNCEPKIELGEKLEDLVDFTENCSYIKLVGDDCEEANKCLNLSINHPIKPLNIIFKNEQCGKRLYWTDGYNPPRYIHLEELEEGAEGELWKTNRYYHKGSLVCKQELDLVQTCLNCDALKIFPEFSIPCLSVETITSGGNLYEGTYEFFIAFCDEDGNEISSYYSHTFPTPIFNFDDLIVDSLDLSRPTTFGINLQVEYLDTNFSYYKIACVFRSALNQTESYVDLGVFPITQTSIMVTTLTNGKPITINRILTTKTPISVVDKMSEANGHLFLGGFTAKPVMNLQPIVNLIGPFMKWNTLIAKDDFYKNPVNSQKFRQYMRDEGYALSICFGIDDGTETNDFPLINRASFTTEDYEKLGIFGREDDLQVLVNNSGETPVPTTNDLNVRSILNGSEACLDSNRIYRFQYYNTAVNKGLSSDESVDTTIDLDNTDGLIKRTTINKCSSQELNGLNEISSIDLQVAGEFQFFEGTVVDFINTIIDKYRDPLYPYYSPILANYLDLTRYTGLGCFYTLTAASTNCKNFILLTEALNMDSGEVGNLIPTYLDFSEYEYKKLGYYETQFSSGVRGADNQLSNKLGLKGYPQIQQRIDFKVGPTCNDSVQTLKLKDIDIETTNGYIFKNLGSTKPNYLETLVWDNYESSVVSDTINYPMRPLWSSGTGVRKIIFPEVPGMPEGRTLAGEEWKHIRVYQQFTNKIAKNAIWFSLSDLNTYPYLQINFSTLNEVEIEDNEFNSQFNVSEETDVTLNRLNKVRLSIFDGCSLNSNKVAIHTIFLQSSDEPLFDLKNILLGIGADINKNYVIAFDCPIQNAQRQIINLVRIFEKDAAVTDGAPTPEELRFMEKFEEGGETYYRARNVTNYNQPAYDCIVEGNISPIAWSEDGIYNPLCNEGVPIPPVEVVNNDLWTTTTLDKSFLVTQRGEEADFYDLTLNNVIIEKEQQYSQDCYYKDISGEVCGYGNYEEGLFGYQESLETYPDNSDLFDSSKLKTKLSETLITSTIEKTLGDGISDFDIFSGVSFKDLFKINFGTPTNFVVDEKINFTCNPIRHFKFPDNVVSPFINTLENVEYADSYIHPLGINISNDTVNVFLNLAVETGQITQEQRDSIIYFKIKRGYRGSNRSVLSKGFLSDMIKYNNLDGGENYFSNFPFNSLNDKDLILQGRNPLKHQYNKLGNNRFSMISPEILTNINLTPTELKVDGYVYGDGVKQVNEVQDHQKMVVLTESAKNLAKDLGTAEALFELGMKVADLMVTGAASMWFVGGTSTGGNYGQFTAWGGIALGIAFQASEFMRKSWEYRYKWLENFKLAGKGTNFAHYIVGVGTFINFKPLESESPYLLRDIRKSKLISDGNYKINQDKGVLTTINHNDREKSLYLYLGPSFRTDGILYPEEYSNIDSSNKEPNQEVLKKEEEEIKVANLYGALKIYNPSQYGRLHNITWVDTPGCFYLKDKNSNLIFGGDTYISRITYKKKYNYYLASALSHVDFKPIKYSRLDNVGKNKYFIDYDTEAIGIGNYGLPFTDSVYNLQFVREQGKYLTEGRFYHYEYGIHNQLVESELNCWTRVALPSPKDNFYPNFSDYMELTQEMFVSIREPERFYFNSVYSNEGIKFNGKFLPDNYDPKFYSCINNSPSGIAYSQPDKSEKKKVDQWLIFKPFDFYNFKASYGKFISLKSIESQQLLALFEHKLVLLNKIDELRERITPETAELGTGSIFQSRPMEFHSADSGYGGAQHGEILSTEFGHFYVDARRGQIFQVGPNADKMEEITDGLRNWFKEHLPFKILRGSIEGLTDLDLDNNFKGLGLTLGWDPRYKRLFLTKLDYIIKPNFRGLLEYRKISKDNDLVETKVLVNKTTGLEVQLSNTDIFTPCHFTLSYSPLLKTWMSYYSFYPNFYISYDNYFRTGVNENNNLENNKVKKTGLWSHLLTNKSFGVFYGTRYPWSIEINSKEQFNQKLLTNVDFWVDSIRYHNDYDYSQNTELGLDSAIFYNNTNNSGKLNFVNREPNNRFQYTQYPKYNTDGSSDILVAFDEGSWRVNDFYNRTINQNNNVPIWNFDLNAIDKTVNPQAITFKSSWLDRMRGDYFLTRFEGGSDSRYKQIFKWGIINEDIVI